jgi:hypothetical protein
MTRADASHLYIMRHSLEKARHWAWRGKASTAMLVVCTPVRPFTASNA